MDKETAIKKLKEYMSTHNITQVELSHKLGIAHSQLNRWFNKGSISKVWINLLIEKGVISE